MTDNLDNFLHVTVMKPSNDLVDFLQTSGVVVLNYFLGLLTTDTSGIRKLSHGNRAPLRA